MENLSKPSTFRLPDELILQLEGLALIDDIGFAQVVRDAVASYVERRRTSPELPSEIELAKERLNAPLDALLELVSK
jgi:predicted transcriptional regulator